MSAGSPGASCCSFHMPFHLHLAHITKPIVVYLWFDISTAAWVWYQNCTKSSNDICNSCLHLQWVIEPLRFTYKCITRWLPRFAQVPNYAPICCHMHPVNNCPSHKIMSSTCQTIHYDASQYRVYIPVYNFVFVIPKSQWQGPRWGLFCALYTVYWPVSSSGYLSWSFPPSLSPSSHAPLPRSVAPSLLRSLPPSSARFLPPLFPSLRQCLSSFLTRSPPQPFLQSCFHTPSHHRFLTPSPSSPPSPCSLLPSSILPCLPAPCRPIQCTPYVCLARCTVLCSA